MNRACEEFVFRHPTFYRYLPHQMLVFFVVIVNQLWHYDRVLFNAERENSLPYSQNVFLIPP